MGMDRGAIVERWFSSITHVETEGAEEFEGMGFVNVDDDPEQKILFKEFVDELGADLIGDELMEKYGTWPMYSSLMIMICRCSIISIMQKKPVRRWA